MKLKHFSLLFSVLGILVLYFLSKLSMPPLVDIHELGDYDGKTVTVEGIVTEHQTTGQGSQIITIKENESTATVFLGQRTDVEYGDKIQATGSVDKYKDSWEIMVDDDRLVRIIEKWNNVSFPIWQLAENPSRYLDLNVNVTGYIESISNSYLYIVDLDRKRSLIVFYHGAHNVTIFPGQEVSVTGVFCFDKENFRYQILLFNENHKILPITKE